MEENDYSSSLLADGGKTPEDMIKELYELPDNCPEYCIVQGELYDFVRNDARADRMDAVHISQYLNRGEVEEAEDLLYEALEE